MDLNHSDEDATRVHALVQQGSRLSDSDALIAIRMFTAGYMPWLCRTDAPDIQSINTALASVVEQRKQGNAHAWRVDDLTLKIRELQELCDQVLDLPHG